MSCWRLPRRLRWSQERANEVFIKGLRSANANLPDKVVREVRRMARDGRRFKHIGAELGIDPRGVSRIVAGTLYGRVKDEEETQ
jgi:hypothetical protein